MKTWYYKKSEWLEIHPRFSFILVFACTWASRLIYLTYIVTILCLFSIRDPFLFTYILVPAFGFIIETLVRKYINRARPYEVLNIHPLKEKDTHGKSFPSRHCFSAAILSVAFFQIHPILGLISFIFAIIIAICRVMIGVHWISDVIVGLLFGWGFGILGFLI